ncbi:MAG: hypothetical protein FWB80_01750 [Defluviitaleaceae bacterium]|nr:hypothetical protein [Defluviitaleaceae bacterium]
MIKNEEKISLLQSYFFRNGLLLCNRNKELPDIDSIGGDLNSIVTLIEQGDVFYSKLYKNRVSYLSRELYYQIKPYKQRVQNLTAKSKEIFNFLEENDIANTKIIKHILMLSTNEFMTCMDELNKELLVTAIRRDKTINANWISFCWGTFLQWEQLKPLPKIDFDVKRIKTLLLSIMSEKQINNLIKSIHERNGLNNGYI